MSTLKEGSSVDQGYCSVNVVNETYPADKNRLIDAHDQEIKVVTDDSDARLKLLQDELLRCKR